MAEWNIDPDHSVAAFAIRHMMVCDVHGQFNRITGKVRFDPADIPNTSINFEIDAAGIFTGIRKRDDHLRSNEFFHVEKYPKITFQSTRSEILAFNSCKMTGDLTIHGTTKPITAEVEFFGSVKSPFDETSMGFTAKTVINREDFGVAWNTPLENGGLMVGKDVRLFIDLEADLIA
ncbi:MAG: polyisoprenoid-binding protein [Nitrospiraceae bacterium]|nr:MAG: polyisoprenoid-binding protein [Nitrospiraceae bacterium]